MGLERSVEIIKLLSDLGANPSKPGAALGPDALVEYDKERNNFLSGFPMHQVLQEKKRENFHEIIPNAKFIGAISHHLQTGSEKVRDLLKANKFPLVLSGDHSNGAATIAGLRAANPDKKIGVIWVDAHADIHTPYTTPSGNMHGMPVAAALAEDNQENSRHTLEGQGLEAWERIKNLGVSGKANIPPEAVMFIEVRDTETEEDNIIFRQNIRVIGPGFRETNGINKVAAEAKNFAAAFDAVYVSFDIDSMGAQYVPGTGTPVEGGMSPAEAKILLSQLWKLKNLSAIEFTEINPTIEKETTLASVYEAFSGLFEGS